MQIGFLIFGIVVFLWFAFGAALLMDAAGVERVWRSFRRQPTAVQVIVWIVLLPWVIALSAWESNRPVIARLAAIALLAAVTIGLLYPS